MNLQIVTFFQSKAYYWEYKVNTRNFVECLIVFYQICLKVYLECAETVPQFNNVNQTVEIIWSKHKAISLLNRTPPPKHEVSSQTMLQRPCQMFIEDWIKVIVICSRVPDSKLTCKSGVAVICSFCVVISLPKLNWTDIGHDEKGWA